MCGGTPRRRASRSVSSGLSPRVRGNLDALGHFGEAHGSIPACAGEPHPNRPSDGLERVYPRVCGGTSRTKGHRGASTGLSPRVRGNPDCRRGRRYRKRSIPACAGEPRGRRVTEARPRVYPRVCGGTPIADAGGAIGKGLSPRVRGNPTLWLARPERDRSIPACAGEPWQRDAAPIIFRVYPRVCGGTRPVEAQR